MKTKKMAIREAWGSAFPKNGVDENGWSKKSIRYECFDLKYYDSQNYLEGAYIRPKSLKGIENNNGWSIVDITNLPKQGFFKMGKFKIDNEFYISHDEIEFDEMKEYYLNFGFTHYRQIDEILPALY